MNFYWMIKKINWIKSQVPRHRMIWFGCKIGLVDTFNFVGLVNCTQLCALLNDALYTNHCLGYIFLRFTTVSKTCILLKCCLQNFLHSVFDAVFVLSFRTIKWREFFDLLRSLFRVRICCLWNTCLFVSLKLKSLYAASPAFT